MKTSLFSLPPILMLGVMSGFFYAFSVSVMPGLDQVSASSAVDAMQGINAAVHNPFFFITFFLTPVVALGCIAALWMSGRKREAGLLLVATVLYLGGVIAPTALINLPLNNALALIEEGAEDITSIWVDYSKHWTLWNTTRTITSLIAFAIAAIAPVMTLR